MLYHILDTCKMFFKLTSIIIYISLYIFVLSIPFFPLFFLQHESVAGTIVTIIASICSAVTFFNTTINEWEIDKIIKLFISFNLIIWLIVFGQFMIEWIK